MSSLGFVLKKICRLCIAICKLAGQPTNWQIGLISRLDGTIPLHNEDKYHCYSISAIIEINFVMLSENATMTLRTEVIIT